jgi:hypothetical protein
MDDDNDDDDDDDDDDDNNNNNNNTKGEVRSGLIGLSTGTGYTCKLL